jgi:hypothetical protein
MSFLSKLFGLGGEKAAPKPVAAAPIEHQGCEIIAKPMSEGGQWRVAGIIAKIVDGQRVERQFIRADLCMTEEEAVEVSQRKGRQIIEQNPRLFSDPSDTGPV